MAGLVSNDPGRLTLKVTEKLLFHRDREPHLTSALLEGLYDLMALTS